MRWNLQTVRKAIVTNWPVKVTALVLSAVLWAAVAAEEPTTQLVPVRVLLSPPPGRALTGPVPSVQALYAGSARELIKLYTSPPVIQKRIPDSLSGNEYTVGLTTEDLVLPRGANVKVQDIQPRQFTVTLDDVARRTVPVVPRIKITTDSGYAVVSGIAVTPASVTVHGPEAAVRAVTRVETMPVELSGVRASVRRQVPLDTGALGVVRPTPEEVEVSAEVTTISERVLAGVPVTVRADRGGSWIVAPPTVSVTVRGPSARLLSITRDSVEVVALADASGGVVRLAVVAPAGIDAAATPDTATLRRRTR